MFLPIQGKQSDERDVNLKLKPKYLVLLKDEHMQNIILLKKKSLLHRAVLADVNACFPAAGTTISLISYCQDSLFCSVSSLAGNGRSRNISHFFVLVLPFQSRKRSAHLKHFQKCSSNFSRQVDG